MSYRTFEVEIYHGRVVSKSGEILPDKASALLIILSPIPLSQPRPIGLAKGLFTVPEDFNAALPADSGVLDDNDVASAGDRIAAMLTEEEKGVDRSTQ